MIFFYILLKKLVTISIIFIYRIIFMRFIHILNVKSLCKNFLVNRHTTFFSEMVNNCYYLVAKKQNGLKILFLMKKVHIKFYHAYVIYSDEWFDSFYLLVPSDYLYLLASIAYYKFEDGMTVLPNFPCALNSVHVSNDLSVRKII